MLGGGDGGCEVEEMEDVRWMRWRMLGGGDGGCEAEVVEDVRWR
jgi:hypothetical protein